MWLLLQGTLRISAQALLQAPQVTAMALLPHLHMVEAAGPLLADPRDLPGLLLQAMGVPKCLM